MHVVPAVTAIAAVALLGIARPAAAQGCTPPANPFFEFQVERPAEYVGDSTVAPRPTRAPFVDPRTDDQALVVQFVVDTLGQPVTGTFRTLHSPSAAAADSVRQVLPRWRFTPAERGGCRVPQLVQTAVDR